MKRIVKFSDQLRRLLASDRFFFIMLGLFVVSAVWVATASLYPMAFDEDFHMGLIDIYSRSLLPYGIEQHRDMAVYGSAAADASYLFHYLFSFPYRLLQAASLPLDVIVVILRFINIALVTVGLVLYRRVLTEANIPKAISHLSLALFMLIPIMPVLAGQVNYDNLLLPITALAFLCTIRISKSLLHERRLPVTTSWALVLTILFGMPIKYAFLPFVASVVAWILFIIFRVRRRIGPRQLIRTFIRDNRRLPRSRQIVIGILVMIGLFFSFHYVTNYLQYGDPIPSCDEVFDEQACLAYGPWQRNYYLKQRLDPSFEPVSLTEYIRADWLPGMSQRLTFAVAGPTNTYQTKQPLPLLRTTLNILTIIGALCLLATFFFTRRYHILIGVTLLATAVYLAPLIWRLYLSYVSTGEAVAVNGRYLLPLLPLITALLIIGIHEAMRRARVARFAPLVAVVLFLFIGFSGGGVATYVIQGESHWFWQGWGQTSHAVLQTIFGWFTIR